MNAFKAVLYRYASNCIVCFPVLWPHWSRILAMNRDIYIISVSTCLYCCYKYVLSMYPRRYWHFKPSLTSDINYETLKMCHFTPGVKEILNWKKITVLPSCLHIPHFLFLGGSEEVGPGRLVPLCPGNTCPNKCSSLMEVDINRVKNLTVSPTGLWNSFIKTTFCHN
jgi:hypothetical protein